MRGTAAPRDPSDDRLLLERSGLFDTAYYAAQDVNAGDDALDAYLRAGGRAGLSPHPLFAALQYLQENPDVAEAGVDPLVHYLRHGWREARRPNLLFDTDFVLRRNIPDRAREPLGAYVREGAAQGWLPHPFADATQLRPGPGQAAWSPLARKVAERMPWPTPAPERPSRIAAVAHVFYVDLWPELAMDLRRLPKPFDLWVTLPPHAIALEPAILQAFPQAHVRATANAGRDVRPFLTVLGELISGRYDAVCKLHTKGGASYPDTWRRLMLEALLGDDARIARILAWFARDPDLAVVGPGDLYLSGHRFSAETGARIEALIERLYEPGRTLPHEWGFFAGSMFWVRPEALRRLNRAELASELATDTLARDGQLSHAVERLFGLIPTLEGRRIGLIERPLDGSGESVHVAPAPARPQQTPLGERLSFLTRHLAPNTLELRRARARTWVAPQGRPTTVVAVPRSASGTLWDFACGHQKSLNHLSVPCALVKGIEAAEQASGALLLAAVDVARIAEPELSILLRPGRILGGARYAIALVRCGASSLSPDAASLLHRFDEVWTAGESAAAAVRSQVQRPVRVVRPALITGEGPYLDRSRGMIVAVRGAPGDPFAPFLLRETWLAYLDAFAEKDGVTLMVNWDRGWADPGLFGDELEAIAGVRGDIIVGTAGLARAPVIVGLQSGGDVWPELLRASAAGAIPVVMDWAGTGEVDGVRVAHRLIITSDGQVAALPKRSALAEALRQACAAKPYVAGGGASAQYGLAVAADAVRKEIDRIWLEGGGVL